MPYLNVRIAANESPEIAEKIAAILMSHTGNVLGKKPEVTSITSNSFRRKNGWPVAPVRAIRGR